MHQLKTKLSLIVALVGIFVLLFMVTNYQPPLTTINQLTTNQLGKQITLAGTITNIHDYQNFQILTIKDKTGTIDLLVNQKTAFKENQTIEVSGTLTQYKNRLQLTVDTLISR